MMKEVTEYSQIKNLPHGTVIHKVNKDSCRSLKLVGTMPGCDNYVILSDGEHLEHLHQSRIEGDFKNKYIKYFIGEYDSKFIGEIMIKNLEDEIQVIREVYIEDI